MKSVLMSSFLVLISSEVMACKISHEPKATPKPHTYQEENAVKDFAMKAFKEFNDKAAAPPHYQTYQSIPNHKPKEI